MRWRLVEALLWVAVVLLPGGVLLVPVALGVHRARLATAEPAGVTRASPRSA